MAYELPGVTLSEQRGAPTPDIPESQRNHVIIGKISSYVLITRETVVRSSTGYVDTLAYTSTGVKSISIVESIPGLNDFQVTRDWSLSANKILWTSTGLIPNTGVTYYVTYYRDRQLSEYTYFTARNVEELYANAGYPEDDKQNVALIGQIAFNVFGIPLLHVQPVKPPYSNTDFQNAISLLKNRNIQSISLLNVDTTVRTAAARHVQERSLPQSRRERVLWTGADVGTAVADIATLASSFSTEEVIFVSPTRANVTWFDFVAGEEKVTTIDGSGIAAIVGLWRDSYDDPSHSLLRNKLSGFALFEADYEDYFIDDALEVLGNAGIIQIVPYRDNFEIPMIVDELTTDSTNAKTSSVAVITAKHYNTESIRTGIDDTFTGRKIRNPAAYAQMIRNYVIGVMAKLVTKGSIAHFSSDGVQTRVGKSFDGTETNPQKVYLSYTYYSVFIHKRTEGSYSLLPN